jgi:hypothetical protein
MKMKYVFGWFSLIVAVQSQFPCTSDYDCRNLNPQIYCVDGFCRNCIEDAHCANEPDFPYCGGPHQQCIQCRDKSQCPSDRPYCSSPYGYCEECLEDDECPSSMPNCVFDDFEMRNRCQCPDDSCQCTNDSDCPSDRPYCSSPYGDCETCLEDDDCPSSMPNCVFDDSEMRNLCRCTDDSGVDECPEIPPAPPCFAPTSTVSIATPEGGQDKILVPQLRVNDRVLTASGDYKKVIAFSTFAPPSKESGPQPASQYLTITLGSSAYIEMTPTHMIYVKGKKYPIEASNVRVGDYLIKKSPGAPDIAEKVVSVDSGYLQGGFGPITEDGTIVVNGFLASCYSNPRYQTSEYVTILGIPVLHRQVFTHMLKSPVRLFCKYISDSPCQIKDTRVTSKMPGHEFVDKVHEFVVKWGIEDLGEVLVGTLALAFFLVEMMLAHIALLGTAGVLFVLLHQQYI